MRSLWMLAVGIVLLMVFAIVLAMTGMVEAKDGLTDQDADENMTEEDIAEEVDEAISERIYIGSIVNILIVFGILAIIYLAIMGAVRLLGGIYGVADEEDEEDEDEFEEYEEDFDYDDDDDDDDDEDEGEEYGDDEPHEEDATEDNGQDEDDTVCSVGASITIGGRKWRIRR